jgi:hypothetical protein
MFDQGHNRLEVLKHDLAEALSQIVSEGAQFYSLCAKTRTMALEYPEFIVWSPELRGDKAVADIWDRSWKRLGSVSVQASREMINAPMW